MFKSAVGAVICNCETYIQEWCCFQHLTGFDRIYICLDRCTDNTFNKIDGLPYEVREKMDVFMNSPHIDGCGFQYRGMQHIYDRCKGEVEWLAMFDDDEYLFDHKQRKINDLLEDIPGDVGQVLLPWIKFTHSNQMLSATPDITRLKHFTIKENHQRVECKAIVRLDNIVFNDIKAGWYHCHYADVSGREVTFDGKDCSRIENPCQIVAEHFDTCLAHYVHGAMEDYVNKHKKWRGEKLGYTIPLPVEQVAQTVKNFVIAATHNNTEDTRMSVYADELIQLLSQCKK